MCTTFAKPLKTLTFTGLMDISLLRYQVFSIKPMLVYFTLTTPSSVLGSKLF